MNQQQKIKERQKQVEAIYKIINKKIPEVIAIEKALDDMEKMLI